MTAVTAAAVAGAMSKRWCDAVAAYARFFYSSSKTTFSAIELLHVMSGDFLYV